MYIALNANGGSTPKEAIILAPAVRASCTHGLPAGQNLTLWSLRSQSGFICCSDAKDKLPPLESKKFFKFGEYRHYRGPGGKLLGTSSGSVTASGIILRLQNVAL